MTIETNRGMVGPMRRAVLTLTVLGGLVAVPLVQAALPETPVLTSTRQDAHPAADTHADGDDLLVFSRSRPRNRFAYDAYLRRLTSGATNFIKLNRRGFGFAGGIDSPLVVYQQVRRDQSDLWLYDIDTGTRTKLPTVRVNTRHWEYAPSISGDWIGFSRDITRNRTRIVLFNRSTVAQRILETIESNAFGYSGQVAGNWFVWTRCAKSCHVFRYNIAARTRLRLPKPAGPGNREHYAASVTDAGVVYLARSGRACGASVKIVRFFGPGDPATGTVVAFLPRGRDLIVSNTRVNDDGSTDVYYDRRRCADNPAWDVYRITDPPPGPGRSASVDSAASSTRALDSGSGKSWPFSHPGKRSR